MKQIHFTRQFKKDYKKMARQGKHMGLFEKVVEFLLNDMPLPEGYRDHELKGKLKGCRECHIQGDWLLIYRNEQAFISFERTGSHSELFQS